MSLASVAVTLELEEWERFVVARRRAGVKQSEIARMAGVSQGRVCVWERGGGHVSEGTVERFWAALEAATGERGVAA